MAIESEINDLEEYKSVVERYYTPKYCVNVCRPKDDYCILIHSNRVCLLTLAPSHPLIEENKKIAKLDFQIKSNLDRLSNKVSGKWKHGAQKLQPTSTIVFAECTDGTQYKISSAIMGKLLEVNEELLHNPNLMLDDPQGFGYIAIILPDIKTVDSYRQHLLNEEQYRQSIA